MSPCRLLPLAAAGLLFSVAARAAELGGTSLTIEDLCAKRVTIAPDPALHGRIAVELAAENPAELTLVDQHGGAPGEATPGAATLVGHFCSRPHMRNDKPTLIATIHVPPEFPIDIQEDAVGNFRIGAVGGPINLKLAGAVAVAAERAASVNLVGSGTTSVSIDQIVGNFSATMSGVSALDVGTGQIGEAHIDLSGVANASIKAPVRDGWFDASGTANITLAHPVGVVHTRAASGTSVISIPG